MIACTFLFHGRQEESKQLNARVPAFFRRCKDIGSPDMKERVMKYLELGDDETLDIKEEDDEGSSAAAAQSGASARSEPP